MLIHYFAPFPDITSGNSRTRDSSGGRGVPLLWNDPVNIEAVMLGVSAPPSPPKVSYTHTHKFIHTCCFTYTHIHTYMFGMMLWKVVRSWCFSFSKQKQFSLPSYIKVYFLSCVSSLLSVWPCSKWHKTAGSARHRNVCLLRGLFHRRLPLLAKVWVTCENARIPVLC